MYYGNEGCRERAEVRLGRASYARRWHKPIVGGANSSRGARTNEPVGVGNVTGLGSASLALPTVGANPTLVGQQLNFTAGKVSPRLNDRL
jgi:hypothetical protein